MTWVPPKYAHDVAILNAPETFHSAQPKGHKLVYIVLLNFGEPIACFLLTSIDLDRMGACFDNFLPIHFLELMHAFNHFLKRCAMRKLIPREWASAITPAKSPRERFALNFWVLGFRAFNWCGI